SSRTQQHDTGCGLALHGVRNRVADARHAEEVARGLFDALRDRQGHLAGFAVADTDQTVAVADDHESGEAEAATALDDLRDAVDCHHALEELVVAAVTRVAVTTALAAVTAATAAFTLLTGRLGSLGGRGGCVGGRGSGCLR